MTSFRLVEEGDILGGKLTHLDYEKIIVCSKCRLLQPILGLQVSTFEGSLPKTTYWQ